MKTMQQLLLGIYLPKVPQGQTIAEHLNILKLFWGFATRFKKTPVSSLPCTIPATSVHGQFQLWTFCIQWTPLGAPIISIGPDQLGAGATTDAASHASLDALFRFLSGCQVKKFTCHRNSWRFKFVQLLYQIVPSFPVLHRSNCKQCDVFHFCLVFMIHIHTYTRQSSTQIYKYKALSS